MSERNGKRNKLGAAGVGAVLSLLVSAISFALPEPAPDPFHSDPGTIKVAEFDLDTTQSNGSSVSLPAGKYRILTSGTYKYGTAPNAVGDAECTLAAIVPGTGWYRNQYAGSPQYGGVGKDILDVNVNGQNVEWSPTYSPAGASGSAVTDKQNPGCDNRDTVANHEYFYDLTWAGGSTPGSSAAVKFTIADTNFADNAGLLHVIIKKFGERPKEELVALLPVASQNTAGVYTPPLIVGQEYRFEISGTYTWGPARGSSADAECSTQKNDTTWREKLAITGVPEDPHDVLDVHLDDGIYNGSADGAVSWTPMSGNFEPGFCSTDANHTYSYTYRALDSQQIVGREVTRVLIKVYDKSYLDNSGVMIVKVFHTIAAPGIPNPNDPLSAPSIPAPVSMPSTSGIVPGTGAGTGVRDCAKDATNACIPSVTVQSGNSSGNTTSVPVPPGNYIAEATGVYQYETGVFADAECSQGSIGGVEAAKDGTWQRNRYANLAVGRDPLDLLIDGIDREWRVKGANNNVICDDEHPVTNGDQHVYEVEFRWDGNGGVAAPINFKIFDPGDLTRNVGSITVKLFTQAVNPSSSGETPMAVMPVNAADSAGTFSPPLIAGRTYLFEVTGKYTYYRYDGPGFEADAECSSKNPSFTFADSRISNSSGWIPSRFNGIDPDGGDPLDLYIDDLVADNEINDGPVTWTPKVPGTTSGINAACAADADKTYMYTFSPTDNGPVRLRIAESRDLSHYADNIGVLYVRIYQR